MKNFFDYKLKLPVISAPMFLVSGIKLVVEACKSGIVGTFPALNARTTEAFEEWIIQIKKELEKFPDAAPFGVNLIVHRSNPRLENDLKICIKYQVPLIITSLGAVSDVVEAVHSYGGVVFHDVTIKKHAIKAAEAGVDGIIAVSAGAGGHAGTIHPFTLLDEIKSFYQGKVLLAGAINHGKHIAAAKILGADYSYMGTRFIATKESQAQDEYKQMILNSESSDIIHTPAVSGVPANFMKKSLFDNGFKDLLEKGNVDFGKKLTVDDEAKAWKDVWSAGHGVSDIKDIPSVSELVERLNTEYQKCLK